MIKNTDGYYHNLIDGIKHKDGVYTGYMYCEEYEYWYRIKDFSGRLFDTMEEPTIRLTL